MFFPRLNILINHIFTMKIQFLFFDDFNTKRILLKYDFNFFYLFL